MHIPYEFGMDDKPLKELVEIINEVRDLESSLNSAIVIKEAEKKILLDEVEINASLRKRIEQLEQRNK